MATNDTAFAAALRACRGQFLIVGLFSGAANLLQLAIPLYTMQVFDRVLAARSADTLLWLTLSALSAPPWCMDQRCGRSTASWRPALFRAHAMRTYSGRPRSSMRFSASAAIATSVARRLSVCERSPSPITRFQRPISASTKARQL